MTSEWPTEGPGVQGTETSVPRERVVRGRTLEDRGDPDHRRVRDGLKPSRSEGLLSGEVGRGGAVERVVTSREGGDTGLQADTSSVRGWVEAEEGRGW